jgi:hypothetical protein
MSPRRLGPIPINADVVLMISYRAAVLEPKMTTA